MRKNAWGYGLHLYALSSEAFLAGMRRLRESEPLWTTFICCF
jgi:hypothetical protein